MLPVENLLRQSCHRHSEKSFRRRDFTRSNPLTAVRSGCTTESRRSEVPTSFLIEGGTMHGQTSPERHATHLIWVYPVIFLIAIAVIYFTGGSRVTEEILKKSVDPSFTAFPASLPSQHQVVVAFGSILSTPTDALIVESFMRVRSGLIVNGTEDHPKCQTSRCDCWETGSWLGYWCSWP